MFAQHSYGTDPETGLIDYAKLLADAKEFAADPGGRLFPRTRGG